MCYLGCTIKPVLSGHSQKDQKLVFKTDYRLMQVKSIAKCSKGSISAILLTFIKLPFSIKTFVFSILEWLLKTGFTVKPVLSSHSQKDQKWVFKTDYGLMQVKSIGLFCNTFELY